MLQQSLPLMEGLFVENLKNGRKIITRVQISSVYIMGLLLPDRLVKSMQQVTKQLRDEKFKGKIVMLLSLVKISCRQVFSHRRIL